MGKKIITSISMLKPKKNPWTGKPEYATFRTIREMWQNTDNHDFYNVIIEKKLFSVREFITGYNLLILENDNDNKLNQSLEIIEELLNEIGKVFIIARTEINAGKIAQPHQVEEYVQQFDNSFLARSLNYKENNVNKLLIKKYK